MDSRERANQASAILNNPVFKDTLERISNDLISQWSIADTTEERERMARAGASRAMNITTCWLRWYINFEPRKACPRPLEIPHETTIVCMQNKAVGKYVSLLRRSMHLRRQQARIVSAMRRLAAAAKVCDACVVLRDKIAYPPPQNVRPVFCNATTVRS